MYEYNASNVPAGFYPGRKAVMNFIMTYRRGPYEATGYLDIIPPGESFAGAWAFMQDDIVGTRIESLIKKYGTQYSWVMASSRDGQFLRWADESPDIPELLLLT